MFLQTAVLSWIKEAFPNSIDAKTHLQKLTKNDISELKNILEQTYSLQESKYLFLRRYNGSFDIVTSIPYYHKKVNFVKLLKSQEDTTLSLY